MNTRGQTSYSPGEMKKVIAGTDLACPECGHKMSCEVKRMPFGFIYQVHAIYKCDEEHKSQSEGQAAS